MASFDYDVVIIGSGFGGSVAALRAIPELEAERDEVLLGFIEVRNRVETATSHKVAAE